ARVTHRDWSVGGEPGGKHGNKEQSNREQGTGKAQCAPQAAGGARGCTPRAVNPPTLTPGFLRSQFPVRLFLVRLFLPGSRSAVPGARSPAAPPLSPAAPSRRPR